MLNKINTLLASSSVTEIKEFKSTSYSSTNPTSSSTITLPAGITDGSLGLLLVGETKTSTSTSSAALLSTPTGFTLIDKTERLNGGTGKGGSQGLFYKYMSAADSSTVISAGFADSLGSIARIVFIEIILNRGASNRGFNSLTNVTGSAGGGSVSILNVPSVIPDNSPFFILGCVTDSDGTATPSFSGGMDAYYTSENILVSSGISVYLWKYDNVRIADLPDAADATVTDNAAGFGTEGVYAIWLK